MTFPGISSNSYYTYNPNANEVLTEKIDHELEATESLVETAVEETPLQTLNPEVVVKLADIATPIFENLKSEEIPAVLDNSITLVKAQVVSAVEEEVVTTTPQEKIIPLMLVKENYAEVIKLAEGVKPLEVEVVKPVAIAVETVKEAPKEETMAEKVQKIFNELLIKEWYLPGIGQGSQYSGEMSTFNPVFSTETLRDIASIRTMIEKTNSLNGSTPIPNLVFVGKPGVGKTIAVQHLCETTGTPYVRIPSGAMEHHLKISTAIPTLHKIFDVVEMCKKPVYIVMDDGEELVAKRPPQSKVRYDSSTKAHWLVEKENFAETMQQRRTALVNAILEESGKDRRNVGFAITTNRAEIIDPAFMTRARVIEFNKPQMEQRKQIIIAHLPIVFGNDMKYLPFFHMGRLENMAQKTKGFTGRNLVEMLKALYALVQMEKGDLRQDMIDACICEQENAIKISDDRSSRDLFRLPKAELKSISSKLKECVKEQFNKIKISTNNAMGKLTAKNAG